MSQQRSIGIPSVLNSYVLVSKMYKLHFSSACGPSTFLFMSEPVTAREVSSDCAIILNEVTSLIAFGSQPFKLNA
ncbi:hypothetical protein NC653_004869 [Populus alba x Populus x berolinensis]|uniref:Uncharacterized protein n=1 Tax=Populus alba x Populus x berolinensis TaxID=444605 RepID=A0AAD6WLJ3_9ROSI|nr:hypothetical protein NC653_004869 [Populus alba x Populus x berolinensis]